MSQTVPIDVWCRIGRYVGLEFVEPLTRVNRFLHGECIDLAQLVVDHYGLEYALYELLPHKPKMGRSWGRTVLWRRIPVLQAVLRRMLCVSKSRVVQDTLRIIAASFLPTTTTSCITYGTIFSSQLFRDTFQTTEKIVHFIDVYPAVWYPHAVAICEWRAEPLDANKAFDAVRLCGGATCSPRYRDLYRAIFDVATVQALRSGSFTGHTMLIQFVELIWDNAVLRDVVRNSPVPKATWTRYIETMFMLDMGPHLYDMLKSLSGTFAEALGLTVLVREHKLTKGMWMRYGLQTLPCLRVALRKSPCDVSDWLRHDAARLFRMHTDTRRSVGEVVFWIEKIYIPFRLWIEDVSRAPQWRPYWEWTLAGLVRRAVDTHNVQPVMDGIEQAYRKNVALHHRHFVLDEGTLVYAGHALKNASEMGHAHRLGDLKRIVSFHTRYGRSVGVRARMFFEDLDVGYLAYQKKKSKRA